MTAPKRPRSYRPSALTLLVFWTVAALLATSRLLLHLGRQCDDRLADCELLR